MKRPISDIAFTPAVKAAQERLGSRRAYASMEQRGVPGPWRDVVTPELSEFIAERDSLYLGTASASGQPYIQHRGGPKGFVKVLDEHTLAFAEFPGNSQYISLGNLTENNKAYIFFMDYPNRHRIKIWGTAEFIENDPELMKSVVDSGYDARPERALVFHVVAWSPNCPLHIRPRCTSEELEPLLEAQRSRRRKLPAGSARP
jgi:predicted pyridoxine 5'-phosphate oxidase superfamily flavin-nucleotide-binding protein